MPRHGPAIAVSPEALGIGSRRHALFARPGTLHLEQKKRKERKKEKEKKRGVEGKERDWVQRALTLKRSLVMNGMLLGTITQAVTTT